MNEAVKNLLGDNLAAQVEAALKGKGKDGKDAELVVGNNGSYVPADKVETERQGRISAENALKAAAAALKDIGGSGDPDKIGQDVKAAQTKIVGLETSHKAELAKIRKVSAVKLGLAGKAHDPNDIIRLLDMEKIEVDDSGNLKTSIDDLIKPYRETKPYLFIAEEQAQPQKPPTVSGVKPAGTTPPASDPMEELSKWRSEQGL